MRRFLSALTAIGMMTAIDAVPAAASPAGNFPFCIKGCSFGGSGGVGDCSFTSYAQCQATASGLAATCYTNPYFSNAELLPNHSRMSPRRY